ncbi:hypothetical protein Vafri_6953 [Volvox africanus]|uniref:Uncharacterized protein n=1 Tax=Volvox africanus TaxID=51714 RepID=A0A8J4EXJ7_9CHLO|nr:hypothetical protein Vafri_6953 [Volvox africanus]
MVRDGCVLQVTDAFKDTAPVPAQPSQIPAPALFPAALKGAEGPECCQDGGTDPCDYFPPSRSCNEASGDVGASATQRGSGDVFGGSPGSGRLRQTVLTLSSGPAAAAAEAEEEVTLYDSAMRWQGKCKCGVPAHFRNTKKPGANLGRDWDCNTGPDGLSGHRAEHLVWSTTTHRFALQPLHRSHQDILIPPAIYFITAHRFRPASLFTPLPPSCRQFYSCGRWSISDRSKQCNFFAWADQLQMASGVVGRGPVR